MNFLTIHQNIARCAFIKNEEFLPSFKTAIEKARKEIDAIVENPEHPTFKNTIEALEYSGHELDRISSIFFNLNSAETNDEIQKIAQEVSPLLSEFGNDITLNEDLFKRVKAVYDQKDSLTLTTEQATLLDKKFKGFSRNGALLNEEDKDRLIKQLDKLNLGLQEASYTIHVLGIKYFESECNVLPF